MKQENENNISQHNFAVELLNDTKLATDGPAKARRLQHLHSDPVLLVLMLDAQSTLLFGVQVERLKQLQEVLLFGAPTLIKVRSCNMLYSPTTARPGAWLL